MSSAPSEEPAEPPTRYELAARFAISPDTLDFDAESFELSDRKRELAFRARYYKSSQHDGKTFDFEGRVSNDGPAWARQRMWGATQQSFFVPYDARRPNAPYRLPRRIVRDFTDLIFGHGQFPSIVVKGSPQRESWLRAVADVMKLQSVMVRARNIGGSRGTVGISWTISDGKHCARTHNGENLHVHSWIDRDAFKPAHVSEIYQYAQNERDEKGKIVRRLYWFRRDWTVTSDVAFKPVPVEDGIPVWEVDEANSWEHGDGRPHFVWVVNEYPEESSDIDGQPDYADNYEAFDAIDIVNSTTFSGAKKNLDPTLILKSEKDLGGGIRKGSDNALTPGESGDAKYLELEGTSIRLGMDLVTMFRTQALETSRVVSPDPDKIAAAGTSSVALKMLYRPMLGAGDSLRVVYGSALLELLDQVVAHAERIEPEETEDGEIAYPQDADGEPYEPFYSLPLKVTEVLDANGRVMRDANGDPVVEFTEQRLGPRGVIGLEWPDYFKPGPDDYQKQGNAFTMALGGNGVPAILSQRTAVEAYAQLLNRDPSKEWEQVVEEAEQRNAAAAALSGGMFPPAGAVGAPDGGEVPPSDVAPPAEPEKPELQITPTDLATIVTVNQALASVGLPPRMDEDGFLTIAEFKAKHAESIAAGSAAGSGKPPPTPPVPPEALAPPPMMPGASEGQSVPANGPPALPPDAGDAPPPGVVQQTSKDQAAALAAKMTEHGVEACEHGKQNRCWLCGIERARDFEPGEDGPEWKVAWQPIRE